MKKRFIMGTCIYLVTRSRMSLSCVYSYVLGNGPFCCQSLNASHAWLLENTYIENTNYSLAETPTYEDIAQDAV